MIGLTVTKGDPSEEELAALVSVLLAWAAAPPPDPVRPAAVWRRPERTGSFPGPRSWRR